MVAAALVAKPSLIQLSCSPVYLDVLLTISVACDVACYTLSPKMLLTFTSMYCSWCMLCVIQGVTKNTADVLYKWRVATDVDGGRSGFVDRHSRHCCKQLAHTLTSTIVSIT